MWGGYGGLDREAARGYIEGSFNCLAVVRRHAHLVDAG